jgi:hypothetical protein
LIRWAGPVARWSETRARMLLGCLHSTLIATHRFSGDSSCCSKGQSPQVRHRQRSRISGRPSATGSGKLQTYGTQITARDGRFVACRLRNPETVDDRRASVGLGSLETYLRSALDLYGSPSPAHMPCPSCNAEIEVWLPEMGGQSTVKCPSCHAVTTIRARMRGTQVFGRRDF